MPYIEPSTIESVKQIDLFSYLRERDPDELVRISASTYATKTHDSLKISHGKWFWWSRGFGGRSALDYLIKVRDMSFMDAVKLLNNGGIVPPRNVESAPVIPVQAAKQPFCLPPKSGNETAIRYLESRGIGRAIIDQCIDNETVYRSVTKGHSNVVFVGKDEKGFARYAAVRGCCGDYKGEASGSDKRHAFKLNFGSQTNELHVFQSAIDALSYATLLLRTHKDRKGACLLSLGGIPPISASPTKESVPLALTHCLAENPAINTIRLYLDNDAPGLNIAALISTVLSEEYRVHIAPPPTGKDVNEYLLSLNTSPSRKCQERER